MSYSVVFLITSVLSATLGVLLHIRGRHVASRPLAFACYAVCIWAIGKFFTGVTYFPGWQIPAARLSIAGAIFIPYLYLLFVLRFFSEEKIFTWFLRGLFGLALAFELLNIGPTFVVGTTRAMTGDVWPVPGPYYTLFMFYVAIPVLLGLWRLVQHVREPSPALRMQVMYMLLGSLAVFFGGAAVFIATYGWRVHPLFFALIPLYTVIVFVAIWRHQLFDVALVFRKGIVFSIALTLATATYVFSLFVLRDMLVGRLGTSVVSVTLGVALLAVLLFEPIRKKIELLVDEIFFREAVTIEKKWVDTSQKLLHVLDLQELLRALLLALTQTVQPKGVAIYLDEKEADSPVFQAGVGFEKTDLPDSPFWKTLRQPIHRREIPVDAGPLLSGWLDAHQVDLLVPIRTRDRFLGIILLRSKRDNRPYTLRDLGILNMTLTQIAVAVENAKLHETMLRRERDLASTQRLATIGSMAAGLAHEVKNPLAAIKGMVGVLPENVHDPKFIQDFMGVVPEQIDRIIQLLQRVLQIGRKGPVSENIAVKQIVQEILRLVEHLLRKQNIVVTEHLNDIGDWIVPKEEMMQIVLNLVLNAIQAMPGGGTLALHGSQSDGRVVLSIRDTGQGIPGERLTNIFEPFYTTKNGGTGLGLFVVRSQTALLGGHIRCESEVGKGTIFYLEFPVSKESQTPHPQLVG